jgi:hypothetical protein
MGVVMQSAEPSSAVWRIDQVTWVSNLFATFMLKVRHRGAFESIANSFSAYCALLCSKTDHPEIAAQPANLLHAQLEELLLSPHLSTTRRSAGLPHFVLAILHGSISRSPQLTDDTLKQLLDVLEQPVDGQGERQVHAANIARLLTLDTVLAPRVRLQTGRAFVLAIGAFESP